MGQAKAKGLKGTRPLEEINSEYSMLCGQLGNFTFRRSTLAKEIEVINRRLTELDLEAGSAKQQQEAKDAEPVKAATPTEDAKEPVVAAV